MTRHWRRGLGPEVRALVSALEAQGWAVDLRPGGHVRARCPGGCHQVVMGGTPSDRKAWLNARSTLRRTGCATL